VMGTVFCLIILLITWVEFEGRETEFVLFVFLYVLIILNPMDFNG
jgi:hypothetical protein